MSGAPRVRALALHADYHCRSSGACCTSGWEIPIEPDTEERLRTALRTGALRLPAPDPPAAASSLERQCLWSRPGLPHGARATLGRDGCGQCSFLETHGGNRCAIHRQLGEETLPSACRHFPRVVRLTPRSVDVTLSHYCPTAASRLFVDPPPVASKHVATGEAAAAVDPLLRIVEAPAAFPHSWPYQGLDAREAVPPLLRPGVLMSWAGHEEWERHAVGVMAGAPTAESALDRLGDDAERIRAWTPSAGDFDPFLERELAWPEKAAAGVDEPATGDAAATAAAATEAALAAEASLAAWDEVVATVPAALRATVGPRPEATGRERSASLVAAGWPLLQVPIRRWLAAKAFASWLALQGNGLRTAVAGLGVALGVLRAESLRGCAGAGNVLDKGLLREAARRADLLLLHLADPEALARRLSRCER